MANTDKNGSSNIKGDDSRTNPNLGKDIIKGDNNNLPIFRNPPPPPPKKRE
ncbi:MAG: hypothetical protein ACI9XO_004881 [Paraglaciecola sp.]|jgi:hypothetical protein